MGSIKCVVCDRDATVTTWELDDFAHRDALCDQHLEEAKQNARWAKKAKIIWYEDKEKTNA